MGTIFVNVAPKVTPIIVIKAKAIMDPINTIDRDKISSVMAEGVLRIVLPKKQAYKQRQIDVKAG